MHQAFGSAAVLFAAAVSLFGQAPPAPAYGYEVASVKKSDPAARGNRIGPGPQGGMRTSNTSLLTLITFAWDVRNYQVLEVPGWAKNEGFDVTFTPDKAEVVPAQGSKAGEVESFIDRQRQRLQAVLRDQFGLRLRMETRELPVYSLTIAKSGSKLQPAAPEGKGPSLSTNPDRGEMTAIGINMRMLVNVLSDVLRRPVLDATGIENTFDFKLSWKPEPLDQPTDQQGTEKDGSSLFTAVTEQLGLKLESKKGPVTVYIVEKAERPADN